MDILYLLDRLEEVLVSGRQVPLTQRKLVDERECLDILDQIRVAVPEEIRAARRLAQQREDFLAQAREEADRLISEADQRVEVQVSEHSLVRAAEARARAIEDEAYRAAEQVRRDADQYAYQTLARLRSHVDKVSEAVDQGLEEFARDFARDDQPNHSVARR